jgi:hypothetical protein
MRPRQRLAQQVLKARLAGEAVDVIAVGCNFRKLDTPFLAASVGGPVSPKISDTRLHALYLGTQLVHTTGRRADFQERPGGTALWATRQARSH